MLEVITNIKLSVNVLHLKVNTNYTNFAYEFRSGNNVGINFFPSPVY